MRPRAVLKGLLWLTHSLHFFPLSRYRSALQAGTPGTPKAANAVRADKATPSSPPAVQPGTAAEDFRTEHMM